MFIANMEFSSQDIGGFSTLPQDIIAITIIFHLYSDTCSSQEGMHLFFFP
jgi:hypothetical protein